MTYHFEDFRPCLDQTFELVDGEHRETLTLIQVDELPNAASVDDRCAFSLLFQAGNHDALPQREYRLSNPQLGDMSLFIVPVADADEGIRYEAIFS